MALGYSEMHANKPQAGFTLIELLLVLTIIAMTVTFTIPLVGRSDEGQNVLRESLNIRETIHYGIDLAANSGRPTRMVFFMKDRSYWLEKFDETGNTFGPIPDLTGQPRKFNEDVLTIDAENFSQSGNILYLTFDPAIPWPKAKIYVIGKSFQRTIEVDGLRIELQDTEF